MRRTKIIATLGPASSDPVVLARMIRAGLDVARLNFSHGSRADHMRAIRAVRTASHRVGKRIGVLLDLQGPRLRLGEFEGGSTRVATGAEIWVTDRQRDAGHDVVPIIYSGLMQDVSAGDRILIDDGKVELRVLGRGRKGLRCRVAVGGPLSDHKGVNFPGVRLSAPSLTSKDREDLRFGLAQDVDFVALSFVRSGEDLIRLRRIVRSARNRPLLIAKIERREAIENLEEILDAADGVMVARGDLGVEYPPERVPILQKRIIERANANEVTVITATQMLESMIAATKPTRAEASDVANAIFDGTDAIMLSAETAVGRYPDKVVQTMARIASEADEFAATKRAPRRSDGTALVSPTHALAHTAYMAAREIRARALVIFTHSGYSARLVAKSRPQAPILALTPLEATCRRLSLAWGVHPVMVPRWRTAERMVETGLAILIRRKMLRRGDWVVAMAGTTTRSGGTNMLRILQQGRPPDRPRR
ncbi:MAG: pyruvate kinase [Hyphomicrobiales bacterium]